MEGATAVVTKDGIKEIYRHGWEIEPDPEAMRNEDSHKAWRAKIKVKNLLNNTLNVINWYGKKVLDDKGNVDTDKLRQIEASVAYRLSQQNEQIRIANKTAKKKIDYLSMDDIYPIKKFPTKDIDYLTAQKYGF